MGADGAKGGGGSGHAAAAQAAWSGLDRDNLLRQPHGSFVSTFLQRAPLDVRVHERQRKTARRRALREEAAAHAAAQRDGWKGGGAFSVRTASLQHRPPRPGRGSGLQAAPAMPPDELLRALEAAAMGKQRLEERLARLHAERYDGTAQLVAYMRQAKDAGRGGEGGDGFTWSQFAVRRSQQARPEPPVHACLASPPRRPSSPPRGGYAGVLAGGRGLDFDLEPSVRVPPAPAEQGHDSRKPRAQSPPLKPRAAAPLGVW